MTEKPEDTVTADVGVLEEDGKFYVSILLDRSPCWRSEPCDTHEEARAMIEDLHHMIRENFPQIKEVPVTVIQ